MIDGWDGARNGHVDLRDNGVPLDILVAPYRETERVPNPGRPGHQGTIQIGDEDKVYTSYVHVASHLAAADCTSPFARRGESSMVLVWDGGCFPRLYFVDAGGQIESGGALFPLIGHAYSMASQHFGPYRRDNKSDHVDDLSVAGKLMAYIALGSPKEEIKAVLRELFNKHFEADTAEVKNYRRTVIGCGSTGARRSARPGPGCPTSAPGASPACGAARSPRSPGSAWSTTPSSSAERWPAPRRRSWTRWPGHCSWTTPSAPTCTTWPAPPPAPARCCGPAAAAPSGGRRARPCSGCWTPSPPGRRSSATAGWTCSPPTPSAGRCTRPCTTAAAPPNFARFTFLDTDARRFYPDWDTAADIAVAILRTEAGRDPHDKTLHDLVGELSTCSPEFRRRWSSHDVRLHGAGTKTFHHDIVGDLELAYESVDMVSEPGLSLTIYAAEPASPTAQALALLASWAAVPASI